MPVLAVIRTPLEFGLAIGRGAVGVGTSAVRAALGVLARDPESDRYSVAVPQTQTQTQPQPPAPSPPPPAPVDWEPAPAEPSHVSEEPVQVAEFAEPGAEDGPGPELEVDEPWDGYSRLDAPSVVDQLGGASRETAAAVELYEGTHRGRRTVVAAAEQRLKALSGPAAGENR